MKKVFICLLILGLTCKTNFAQDRIFSQVYANPLYLNPAFTGTDTNQRIGLNFRDQWPNIPFSYTYNVSYNRNVIDSNEGIGILANEERDAQGSLITNNISLLYAHQFHIKSFTLSAGVQFTWLNINFNQSNLLFGDMIDPRRGFVYNRGEAITRSSINLSDYSVGLLGYGKSYFVGFALNHFTQPDESFVMTASLLPMKFVFNGGLMIHIDSSIVISPVVLYQKQGEFNEEQAECYIIIKHFTAGLGYRINDAAIISLGYQNRFLRIGLSYDYTTSALTNSLTGGSYEASLALLLPYKSGKLKHLHGISCPLF